MKHDVCVSLDIGVSALVFVSINLKKTTKTEQNHMDQRGEENRKLRMIV